MVPWARIFPLLAAVTPRSRYLKKERRPATRGAVVGVAYASFPGGFTAAGCPIGMLASFIMEAYSELVPSILPDPHRPPRRVRRPGRTRHHRDPLALRSPPPGARGRGCRRRNRLRVDLRSHALGHVRRRAPCRQARGAARGTLRHPPPHHVGDRDRGGHEPDRPAPPGPQPTAPARHAVPGPPHPPESKG